MSSSVNFKCNNENFIIFAECVDTLNKEKYRIHGIKIGKTIQEIEDEICKIYAKQFIFRDCVVHYYFDLAYAFDVPEMILKLTKMYPNYNKIMSSRNTLIRAGELTNCQIENRIQSVTGTAIRDRANCNKCHGQSPDHPSHTVDCSEELNEWYNLIRSTAKNIKRGRPKLTDNQRVERAKQTNLERKKRISEIYNAVNILRKNVLTCEEIDTLTIPVELKDKLKYLYDQVSSE